MQNKLPDDLKDYQELIITLCYDDMIPRSILVLSNIASLQQVSMLNMITTVSLTAVEHKYLWYHWLNLHKQLQLPKITAVDTLASDFAPHQST